MSEDVTYLSIDNKQFSGEVEPNIKTIVRGDVILGEAEPNMTSPSPINLMLGDCRAQIIVLLYQPKNLEPFSRFTKY